MSRKQFKTLLIAVIGTALILIVFLLLNRLGNEIRGYFAVGGEGLIFLLPFIIVLVVGSWHEIIDLFKR